MWTLKSSVLIVRLPKWNASSTRYGGAWMRRASLYNIGRVDGVAGVVVRWVWWTGPAGTGVDPSRPRITLVTPTTVATTATAAAKATAARRRRSLVSPRLIRSAATMGGAASASMR